MRRMFPIAMLSAAVLASSAAAAEFKCRADIERIYAEADANPGSDAARRAKVLKAAIGMAELPDLEKPRYEYGKAGEMKGGCARFDCSGFVAYAVAAGGYKLARASAADMYAAMGSPGKDVESRPGDVVYFGQSGSVDHTGIYLGCEQFIEMPGRPGVSGKPIRITDYSLGLGTDENGRRIEYRDRIVGYGSVSALPIRTGPETPVSGATKRFEIGPNLPGGVYISADLIAEALAVDPTGALDALEREISNLNFDENPVQELPPNIQLPPGFNDENDPPSLPNSPAFRQLLDSASR